MMRSIVALAFAAALTNTASAADMPVKAPPPAPAPAYAWTGCYFAAFAVDFHRFHQHCGQAFGDFFLVELSLAIAVGISPSQPGGEAMEKHLRAVIDHHLSKARSATTMEEMKSEYEDAITGILNAYKAVLAIVNVGSKNDLFIKADEGTKH